MFNEYPYRNLTDLNLDYILNAIKTFQNEVTNFVSINAIKYANPIQWDITRQYEKNTIVIDPVSGTAYISVAPVPSGVALTRPEYWTVVFDLSLFIVRAAKNFTNRYEAETTLTATFPTAAGQWLVWGDTLYVANVNITAGDSYVIDSNIRHITVEEVKNSIYQLIQDNYDAIIGMIGSLDDLTTTAKDNIVAAINELKTAIDNEVQARQDADATLQQNIDNETQARQNADNVLNTLILSKIAIDATNPPTGYLPLIANDTAMDNAPRLKALLDDFAYIYVPSGTYTIKSNISMTHGNFTLFGDNDNTIFKIGDDVAKSEMFVFIPSVADIKNITLKNFKWDGNKAGRGISQDIQQQSFITAFTVSQYNIENIILDGLTMINGCGFVALFAGHSNGSDMTQYITRNVVIKNCIWYDNDAYIGTSGAEHVTVEDCVMYHNGRENLCFDNNSVDCVLRNSYIGTSYGGVGSVGIGTCNQAVIENCVFDYELDTTQPNPDLRNCVTIANDFGAAMFYSIRNCIFKNASNYGIRIIYTTTDTISGEIINCEFKGCTNGAIKNEIPYDKGILTIANIIGSTPKIINSGSGNVKRPALESVWRADTTSYDVSGSEKILNNFTNLVNHKMGALNTRGVPKIPISGFYLVKCNTNVRLNASNPRDVATDTHPNNLKIMVNGVQANRDQHSGFWYDCFSVEAIMYLNKDDSIEFWLTDFDTSIAAIEKTDASISYLGTIIPNIIDLP